MTRKKLYSEEEFLRLYNQGYNDYQMAKKLGVGRTAIWNGRRRNRLKPIGKKKKSR